MSDVVHAIEGKPNVHVQENLRPPQAPTSNPVYTPTDKTAVAEHRLYSREIYWRDRYLWLKEQGYLLRPRYHPDWIASWKGTDKSWLTCEDGHVGSLVSIINSATRISDGKHVMLKKLVKSSTNEVTLGRLFSEEPLRSRPSNHCIPLLDVLSIPEEETAFLVIPFMSSWDIPPFETIGEAIAFFKQLFEGVEFMHSLNVAHNDIKFNNVMMDSIPLYNEPIHAVDYYMNRDYTRPVKRGTRTLSPVKYYFIDFGSACQYNPEDGPPRVPVGYGGDQSVPEFQTQTDCDPFAVDVYRVGNIIREGFTDGDREGDGRMRGFDFMRPLLQDMCRDDPQKRPTITEVVSRFEELVKGLGGWKLRSRVISKDVFFLRRAVLFPGHWTKQVLQLTRGVAAIPNLPKSPP